MLDFSIIVLLLAVSLCTSIIILVVLSDWFDRMFRDSKIKDVKK